MGHPLGSTARRFAAGALVVATGAFAAGCSLKEDEPDLVAGKKLFVEKCGSCHVLKRAGTKGITGPNLDDAFQQPRREGFGESAIRGVVRKQIEFPARGSQMPAGLVEGDDAADVSAYVAEVASRPGEDTGVLADAVEQAGGGKPIAAEDGVLSIAADPGGQLAYVSSQATAPPASSASRARTSPAPRTTSSSGASGRSPWSRPAATQRSQRDSRRASTSSTAPSPVISRPG